MNSPLVDKQRLLFLCFVVLLIVVLGRTKFESDPTFSDEHSALFYTESPTSVESYYLKKKQIQHRISWANR